MSLTIGYWCSVKGTSYRSLQISRGGPTIYQGETEPSDVAVEGDLWIKTGISPAFYQFISGDWSAPSADLTALLNSVLVPDTLLLHVSNNVAGSYVADGTVFKPYKTIQAAHDAALTNMSPHVTIMIHGGSYAGATLTRPKTSLVGPTHGMNNATNINSGFVINPSTVSNGGYVNSMITFENLQISTSSSAPLTITGTNEVTVNLDNIKIFSTFSGGNAILANNTGGTKLKISNCDINNIGSNAITLDLTGLKDSSLITDSTVYSGAATSLAMRSGFLNAVNIFLGSSYDNAIQVDGGTFNLARSTVFSDKANSSALDLKSGSTNIVFDNFFNVPVGTGYAIKGVSGATLLHAKNIYYANNKISTAMGGGIVALNTTPSVV